MHGENGDAIAMAQKATFDAGITGPEGHIISRPAYLEVGAVLCCAVLCCAVLCCAVLCCAVLCCAVLCCAVLCCAVMLFIYISMDRNNAYVQHLHRIQNSKVHVSDI